MLGWTDFSLFWHGEGNRFSAGLPDASMASAKKAEKNSTKCILAVDGLDWLHTLPARLKRDSRVARRRSWFWPEFGTANWNSILSRFITLQLSSEADIDRKTGLGFFVG
jgi:hypothetical protein